MLNNVVDFQTDNLNNLVLGQAYVPYQQYRDLFDINEVLYRGTMFKELYKPYNKMKSLKK